MAAVRNLLSIVADHYDLRNNERHYRIIAFTTQAAGWVLCGLAVLAQMFRL